MGHEDLDTVLCAISALKNYILKTSTNRIKAVQDQIQIHLALWINNLFLTKDKLL